MSWLDVTIKKRIKLSSLFMLATSFYLAPLYAQTESSSSSSGTPTCSDSISCLQAITANTYGVLQAVNNLPTYLNNASQYILNWTSADNSPATQGMQSDFTTTGNQFINDYSFVNNSANLVQMMTDTLGGAANNITTTDFTNPATAPAILKMVSNANDPGYSVNDLAYSTLLNLPPVMKGAPTSVQQSAYRFIKNASGMNIQHAIPMDVWGGKNYDKVKYQNYFNNITAAISYNAYILDSLVAENASGNALNSTQLDLVTQATSGKWLAAVATENLGIVLRQLLMFQSQTYVLFTQLLKTQKQMLTAQVMTNSLLIATNQTNEAVMAARAQNLPLT